jgi:hypothetical protein
MKWALTEQLLEEAKRYELRSACVHCFYWNAKKNECNHGWPDDGQRRWPLDAKDANGETPTDVAFCKEFELR